MNRTLIIILLLPLIGFCQAKFDQNDELISVQSEAQIQTVSGGYKGKLNPINTNLISNDIIAEGQTFFTGRAGLVLTSPFLPTLFERLGYLENGIFPDEQTKNRAVYILEYMATGIEDVKEHELVIQKLLVGLAVDSPIEPIESLTEKEMELSKSMLQGMIENWEKLGNTSIDGLRLGFLVREGMLTISNERMTLDVANKAVDVLMNIMPWNIDIIKLPWMEKPIYVNWR